MFRIVFCASLLAILSGCAVKSNPAKTSVQTPYGNMEYHCPPGQRKKGKC